jgi:hypothetical protein
MEIIIPAAGLSTRFPNMRPKYILTDYTGKMMFERAIGPFVNIHPITIGILQEHEDTYQVSKYIKHVYGNNIQIVILPEVTTGPADTVYQILEKSNIDPDKEILIKDCDSFFDHEYQTGNYICVSRIEEHNILKRLASKSFVISNDQGIVTNIIEKQVISNTFCVGGYKFESAKLFKESFERLRDKNIKEIFVSHIIEDCLSRDIIFKESLIKNYVDVGTAEDWFGYNDKSVIFCDIDGTIVKAQGKFDYDQPPVLLESNIERLRELDKNGSEIIFTTARPQQYYDLTDRMLRRMGFSGFRLLCGLSNTKRILINDYNDANPHPRAIAINLRRDQDNLKDFL